MLLAKKIECLVCFKDTKIDLCYYNLFGNKDLCCLCFEKIEYKPRIIKYKNNNILILYKYNKILRQIIKQWKINKCPRSLNFISQLIKKHLKRSRIYIYPPSIIEKNQKNNIELLLTNIKRKSLSIFKKEGIYEQKDMRLNERKSNIKLVNDIPQNFLLFDDIYTSGKTIENTLDILQQEGYSELNVLIIASNSK